jgi:hypothetical protein
VKKRQIKKLNITSKRLLEKLKQPLEFAKLDAFDAEENAPAGTWVFWYQTDYWHNEWEFQTAYCWLHELLYWEFIEADWSEDGCDIKFTPDLSTAKKVFDLAKQLVGKSAGGGV